MKVRSRIDELRVDPHPVRVAPHRSFQDVRNPERVADLANVPGAGPILPHRSATDHLQVRDLRQIGKNVVLDAIGEIGVLLVVAQVLER
jgi:hypothetical protein